MSELSELKRLTSPQASDRARDETLGKSILLRRRSGESMITIFDGGHESHPDAAFEWLSTKRHAVTDAPGKSN